MSRLRSAVESSVNSEGIIPLESLLRKMDRKSKSGLEDSLRVSYEMAYQHHKDELRNELNPITGQHYPYMQHLSSVAMILANLGYGSITIMGSLLHDAKDSKRSYKDLDFKLLPRAVEGIVDTCTDFSDHIFTKAKKDQKEDFLLYFFKELWAYPEAVAVKLADRLHNLWSLDTYKFPAKVRILQETIDYYLPLAKFFDRQLYKELVEITSHYLKDDNLSVLFQRPQDYEELNFRLYNYASVRSKETLVKELDKNDEITSEEMKNWAKGVSSYMDLFSRSFDLPNLKITKIGAWVHSISQTVRELITKRRTKNLLEYYFERDPGISAESPEIIQYGLQREIPRIDFLEAIWKLKRYDRHGSFDIVRYSPENKKIVESIDLGELEDGKPLPRVVQPYLGKKVNCVTQEVKPRESSVQEISERLSQSGIDLLESCIYTSLAGEKIAYLKLGSKQSINYVVKELRKVMDIDNPMMSYDRFAANGKEEVRLIFDALNLDPVLVVQPSFMFHPYVVVDIAGIGA